MLCFKDKTFCSSDCINKNCHRNFTEEEKNLSILWGGPDAPVAFSDYSENCSDYKAPFVEGQKVRVVNSGTIWDGVEGRVQRVLDSDKWPVFVTFDGAGNGFKYEELEIVNDQTEDF